jgi:hypothetical protein
MFGWIDQTLDLDRPIDMQQVDPTTANGAWELFLHTLRGAMLEDSGALQIFYHESNNPRECVDLVRQVVWSPKSYRGSWVEYVPMGAMAGRQVIARLRRLVRKWRTPGTRV